MDIRKFENLKNEISSLSFDKFLKGKQMLNGFLSTFSFALID